VILPVTTNFERNDIAIPWCRGDYAIFANKAVEPLWDSKSDLDIARDLAERLGIDDFNNRDEDEMLSSFFHNSEFKDRLSYEEFKQRGLFRLGEEPYIVFKDQIQDPSNHPFPTPTGKIEILSRKLAETNFNVRDTSSVVADYRDIPLIPMFVECDELPTSPKAKVYPLQLTTPHHTHRAHSQFFNIPKLRDLYKHEGWIHPQDAQERGIEHGDVVQVFNDRGCIQVLAKVTDRIMQGVVRCYEGGWFDPDDQGVDRGGCVNVLIDDMLTSPAGTSNFNTCLVDIRRA
jgi:anaerobic dimethyl sulfoxide reductase subunit A